SRGFRTRRIPQGDPAFHRDKRCLPTRQPRVGGFPMINAKRDSGRRAFLRGAGTLAIGLPLLEYTHGHAWAQGTSAKRFITVFSHGGTIYNRTNSANNPTVTSGGSGSHLDWWSPIGGGESLTQLGKVM